MTRKTLASVWVAFLVSMAGAQQVPSSFFGLNLHPQVIAQRNALSWPSIGFGAFRFWGTETTWNDLNPSENVYNFAEMDTWLAAAAKNGTSDFLYTFGETPAWAASQPANKNCDHYPGSCNAPKDLNADGTGPDTIWKNFVTAVVKHAGGRIHYWEVWNEPDIAIEWVGTNAQLVRMARDAYAIIKAYDPTAQVLSPCAVDSSGTQTIGKWLPGYVKAGGLQYADIIAFHGYIDPAAAQTPEGGETGKVAAVRAAVGKTVKPIWDTEGDAGQNSYLPFPDMQVAYLARMYLVQASLGVQRFYWWQYGNTEMGTLATPAGLTSSGTAYAQLAQWLTGSTFVKPCAGVGMLWTCTLRTANGVNEMIVWDAGQWCNATVCGTTLWPYPSEYHSSITLAGKWSLLPGGKVPVGAMPILLSQWSKPTVEGAKPMTATPSAGGTVDVACTPGVPGPGQSAPVSFNFYRQTISGNSCPAGPTGYTLLNSTPQPSCAYADQTVQPSTTYCYTATALNSGGQESTQSTPAIAVVPALGPPPPPTGLSVVSIVAKDVKLKWTPPQGVTVESQTLYRCRLATCPAPPVAATLSGTANSYTDECGYPQACWYEVTATVMMNGKKTATKPSNIVEAKM